MQTGSSRQRFHQWVLVGHAPPHDESLLRSALSRSRLRMRIAVWKAAYMPIRPNLHTTLILILIGFCATAEAQRDTPRASVILIGGYAGFVDERIIHHTAAGGGAEWILTSRLAIGPEVLYMTGPGSDRDLFVVGVARFGLLPFTRRVVPFATIGGGVMTHSDRFSGQTFRSAEGAFVAGGGIRVVLSQKVYVAPELIVGWEPHVRGSVNVGIRLP